MSQATRTRLMLAAAGAALFTACTASAQFSPPPTREVSIIVPDGGITVSGSVVSHPPDGGMRVTLGNDVVPVSGTVSTNVIGTVPVSGTVSTNVIGTVPVSGAVSATVSGGVIAYPPDGGSEVRVTNNVRLEGPSDVTVTGQSAPFEVYGVAGARVGIEGPVTATISGTPAVTVTSGTVGISGTVALNTASLNTITAAAAERICTYAVGDPDSLTLSTTPADIPSSPLVGRTALTIWNFEATREIWCNPTGTATDTAAVPVIDGTSLKLEGLNGTTIVSCRCQSSTCSYAYLEEKCYQPTP